MDAYSVERYFLQIEPELQASKIVGESVYLPGDNMEVGVIQGYDAATGFAKIRLFDKVNYRELVNSGIPFNHIIFEAEA